MIEALLRVALRAALCAAVAALVWRSAGPTAMVGTLPFAGLALARPLIELAGELRRALHARVWRSVEGRHYAFHGIAVQVLDDVDHRRWVRVADIRRIVGATATDGALALSYPDGFRVVGRPPEPHLDADALVAHLAKETSPRALRLRRWVEREVAFPARRVRERLGIRAGGPDATHRRGDREAP